MDIFIYSACGNIIGITTKVPSTLVKKEYLPQLDQLIVSINNHITIYNQDDSLAKQCGNGLRALAHHFNLPKNIFYIENTPYSTYYQPSGHWVSLPLPKTLEKKQHEGIPYTLINMGNPHAIFDEKWLPQYPQIASLQKQYNVSFIHQKANQIYIKTFERGVGLTESCGSAACASAFLAYTNNPDISKWKVISKGGTLTTLITDRISITGSIKLLEHIDI